MNRVCLVPQNPAHLRALLESEEHFRAQSGLDLAEGVREFLAGPETSPEFLAKLNEAAGPDPWTFGFAVVLAAEERVIGVAGFKGPPGEGGVEIAYGTAPAYEGRGFGTEAAWLLIDFAVEQAGVQTVLAHTLPEHNASTRVLEKNGFVHAGVIEDPEDGTVWRWQKDLAEPH